MDPVRNKIRENLIYYLKKRGMSQKHLAKSLNTSEAAVTCWTKGRNSPDLETIVKICDILNITLMDLFGTNGTSDYTELEKEIIKRFRDKTQFQESILYLLDLDKDYRKK